MKLSTRIDNGENTEDLKEAIAKLCGWKTYIFPKLEMGVGFIAWHRGYDNREQCPDYLTDFDLLLKEINWHGMTKSISSDRTIEVVINNHLAPTRFKRAHSAERNYGIALVSYI